MKAGLFIIALLGCSPAAEQRVQYTIEETAHGKASVDCIQVAKLDSGTLAEFCDCWTKVQAAHHVDAGECR